MLTTAQTIGLRLISAIAQRLVSRGLFERIRVLVIDAAARLSAPGTGAEKKAWVLDRLADEAGWIGEEVKALPSWLVSMLVDVVVASLKARA